MCKGSSLSKRRGLRRDQLALPNQGSEIVTKNNEFTSCDFAAQLRNRSCFAHRTKIVAYHSFRGWQELQVEISTSVVRGRTDTRSCDMRTTRLLVFWRGCAVCAISAILLIAPSARAPAPAGALQGAPAGLCVTAGRSPRLWI